MRWHIRASLMGRACRPAAMLAPKATSRHSSPLCPCGGRTPAEARGPGTAGSESAMAHGQVHTQDGHWAWARAHPADGAPRPLRSDSIIGGQMTCDPLIGRASSILHTASTIVQCIAFPDGLGRYLDLSDEPTETSRRPTRPSGKLKRSTLGNGAGARRVSAPEGGAVRQQDAHRASAVKQATARTDFAQGGVLLNLLSLWKAELGQKSRPEKLRNIPTTCHLFGMRPDVGAEAVYPNQLPLSAEQDHT